MTSHPITDKVKRLRQRQLASGAWRVWWEPEGDVRAMGFESTPLDPNRPTWSVRQAKQLNADVDRARGGGSLDARAPTGGRTINALIHLYRQSHKFKDRAEASKRSYNLNLSVIERKWGTALVADFTKPVMYEWYQTLLTSSGSAYAKGLIGMMSILFSFSELKGWRPENSNPCFRLGLKSVRKRKRSATWDEYDQLIHSANQLHMPTMACAIAMATLSSQRQSDVIMAKIEAFRLTQLPDVLGQPRSCLAWELIRSKKDNYGMMPLHPELEPLVTAQIGDRASGFLLIDDATGQHYSADLFRKRWATVREHAARKAPSLTAAGNVLQFRDLRRTFGTWARAGGASKGDVGDVLGNSAATDPQLGEIYMPPSFHTAARAVFSISRPEKERLFGLSC